MYSRAELLKCELAAETLRASGYLRLRATGYSMLPAVLPGDILHVRRCAIGDVPKGAIALFECYGRLVAHRVVEIVRAGARPGSGLITRGDSMPATDPLVTEAELLGVVVSIERGRRKFRPAERRGPASRLASAVALRSAHASKWIGRAGSLFASVRFTSVRSAAVRFTSVRSTSIRSTSIRSTSIKDCL
jgi:hypothetical protein